MRILLVSDVFPPKCGGVGWGAYHLALGLQARGHAVTILRPDDAPTSRPRLHRARVDGLPVVNVGWRWRPLLFLSLRRALRRLAVEGEFDMIHAQHLQAVLACAAAPIPYVASLHDYWPLCYKGTLYRSHSRTICPGPGWAACGKCVFFENTAAIKLVSLPATLFLRWRSWRALRILRRARGIVYISRFVEKLVRPLAGGERSIVAHSTALDRSVPEHRFARRTLLYVGKGGPAKSPDLLVEVARRLPQFDVVLVGTGGLGADPPANVHLVDYLPNETVLAYMKGAYAVIHPAAWNEPLGRTVIEACMVGACVVASARGGIQEVIRDGDNGLLVEPNVESLEQAIRRLERDEALRSRLRRNARARYDREFRGDAYAREHEELYRAVLGNLGASPPRHEDRELRARHAARR